MLLLALENSSGDPSAALWDAAPPGGVLRAARAPAGMAAQGDRLIELIDGLLADAGSAYRDLGAIAVDCGPGSFTGVRTAVAAARALALAIGCPTCGVSGLEVLAAQVPAAPDDVVVAALDARRGQVYSQSFTGAGTALGPPSAAEPGSLLGRGTVRRTWVVGSGAQLLVDAHPDRPDLQLHAARLDAAALARLVAGKLAAGLALSHGFTLEPLYLRPPDARPQASP